MVGVSPKLLRAGRLLAALTLVILPSTTVADSDPVEGAAPAVDAATDTGEEHLCETCDSVCDGGIPEPPGTIFEMHGIDCFDDWEGLIAGARDRGSDLLHMPIGFGAYHWWQADASGRRDNGYGVNGLRGTYFYYITAAPEYDLGGGHKIGGYMDYRFRDHDPWRSFMNRRIWPYEAYAFYANDELGKVKAGHVLRHFGFDWGGGFWPALSNFDGFMQDPDFGISWEKTIEYSDAFKVERIGQFFFHEDGFNGSFAGADSESFVGINERNTGVVRLVPTWTFEDGSTFALGLNAQVGQVDSRIPTFSDQVLSVWGVDGQWTNGDWNIMAEYIQVSGKMSPARYVSGGPSNKITDFLLNVERTTGPVIWRGTYGLGMDHNPFGRHQILKAGTETKLTNHVDLIIEYVKETVDKSPVGAEYFDAFEFIVFWHF